ncbi:MAG: cupin domain-containing protein [Candidatus Thorarchaeota archaeon]|jgi:quercetin dioxygenase-like cupin family protein
MKVGNVSNLERKIIPGIKGHVESIDVLVGTPTMGVRIIPPNSHVPKPKHEHLEAQVIYVISGHASITNGVDTHDLEPGDYVLLESLEEHYVKTGNESVKVFEVKYEV